MLWPVLEVVREHGGSATVQEIDDGVAAVMALSDEELSILHGTGPRTEIGYRLAWCRTYLKKVGALDNSARGVWSITDYGRQLTETDMGDIPARVHALRVRTPAERRLDIDLGDTVDIRDEVSLSSREPEGELSHEAADAASWKERLLAVLVEMDPSAFERLCQRLLREAGFSSVEVTGKSGDGGIDGIGVLQMSLLSFPVFFQSKRFRGSVGSAVVRDFRGAMSGRGDKGLLITTGTFSASAKAEGRRPGAPPVDLIDGDRLCDLLREYGLGVHVVEAMEIDESFFGEI